MRSQVSIAIYPYTGMKLSGLCMGRSPFLFMHIPWIDPDDSLYWVARGLEWDIEMSS